MFFLAAGCGWREALDFEGSTYVGLVAKILEGLPFTDMAPDWQITLGRRGLLVPGNFFLCYAEDGGPMKIFDDNGAGLIPNHYRVVDPWTGAVVQEGNFEDGWIPPGMPGTLAGKWIPDEGGAPRLYLCFNA